MDKLLKSILTYRKKTKKSVIIPKILKFLYKIDLPKEVDIGENLQLPHNATGLVIHPNTTIGNNVKIYQGVTLGRADIHKDINESEFKQIKIDDDVIICAGAKVICKDGILTVGKGTIIGANAVLMCSTGENEIWAGIPAKRIGYKN